MTLQELEQHLLNLSPTDRLRIVQSLVQSLIPDATEPAHNSDALDLTRDRNPYHPLRTLPLTISSDFDEPMTDLWEALEQ